MVLKCAQLRRLSHTYFLQTTIFLFFRADILETTAINNLLNEYERFSGQSVNYQKSGVFFSANVSQVKRNELSSVLGVHNSIQDGKYLGLPSMVGKSKKRVSSLSRIRFGEEYKAGLRNLYHEKENRFSLRMLLSQFHHIVCHSFFCLNLYVKKWRGC